MPKKRDVNKVYTEPVYHCRPTSFTDFDRLINGNLRGGSRSCYTFEKWLGILSIFERGYVKHYCKFSDQFWYEYFDEHSQHIRYDKEITHDVIEQNFFKEKKINYEQRDSEQAG